MSIMKQTIMDSAAHFFTKKGYHATSIQDIADDCRIAKGSVYKFFPSKEDIFIEVHHSRNTIFFEEIKQISLDQTLSKQEVFIRETEYQFHSILNNKFIIKELIDVNATEGKISSYTSQMRSNIFIMIKEAILRRFGNEIEPHIWDLNMVYSGIFHGYLFLMIHDNKVLNIREISVYIAERIEDVVAGLMSRQPQPVLQHTMMDEYVNEACTGHTFSIAEQIDKLIENLQSTVHELVIPNYRKTQLFETIAVLQEEMEQDHPKLILIRALLHYMVQEPELKGIICQLEKLVSKE